MALNNVIRRTASQFMPLAVRGVSGGSRRYNHRCFSFSSLFAATVNSSSDVSKKLFQRSLPSAIRQFSNRPASDDSLIRVLRDEIQCAHDDASQQVEVPEKFPFKLENNPGMQTVTLTREYNGETITVEVHMSNLITGEDNEAGEGDDDDEENGSSSLPLVVRVSKSSGPCLEFGCTAYPDEISIESLSVKDPDSSEEQIAYEGPNFEDLDENLQKAFHKYLEIRGIKPSTTNFLHEYMINKDGKEYMNWLQNLKKFIEVHLQVAAPLDPNLLGGLHLGLEGEHQYINAGLAIALCSTWLQRTGHLEINYLKDTISLPEQFIKGLSTAALQGRAQVVPDCLIESENPGDLVFYIDGAHSPESMDVCAKWFSVAIREDYRQHDHIQPQNETRASNLSGETCNHEAAQKNSTQILLFNCMSVRDPQLLLPRLMNACASHGVHFKKALFVLNTSVYYKVGTSALPPADTQVDLSWQLTLQRIWENLVQGEKGRDMNKTEVSCEEGSDDREKGVQICENSSVFPSLPMAINWLRESVRKNQSVRFQVLVTGSLHLVGDVMRLVKK